MNITVVLGKTLWARNHSRWASNGQRATIFTSLDYTVHWYSVVKLWAWTYFQQKVLFTREILLFLWLVYADLWAWPVLECPNRNPNWGLVDLDVWLAGWMIDQWVNGFLIEAHDLIELRTDWFIAWLMYQLSKWLIDWFTDLCLDWLTDCSADWFIDLWIDITWCGLTSWFSLNEYMIILMVIDLIVVIESRNRSLDSQWSLSWSVVIFLVGGKSLLVYYQAGSTLVQKISYISVCLKNLCTANMAVC